MEIKASPSPSPFTHYQDLLNAIKKNETAEAIKLISSTRAINAIDTDGYAVLHYAASMGNLELIRNLLRVSAHINIAASNGDLAIHLAAKAGKSEAIATLIKADTAVDTPNNAGETPLMLAVQRGDMGSVQHLLAKLDITKIDFAKLLKAAIAEGHAAVIAVLFRGRAAQVKANNNTQTEATKERHKSEKRELADLLYAAVVKGDSDSAKQLIEAKADIHLTYDDENTALHLAMRSGHIPIVELLMMQNAQPYLLNYQCEAASKMSRDHKVQKALQFYTEPTDTIISRYESDSNIEVALAEVKEKNGVINGINSKSGYRLLDLAIEKQDLKAVSRLLEAKASTGPTFTMWPLGSAIKNSTDNIEILFQLLKANADCSRTFWHGDNNDHDFHGRTALTYLACQPSEQFEPILQALIDFKANLNAEDGCDETPIAVAAYEGHEQYVGLLLKHNAKPKDIRGDGHPDITLAWKAQERSHAVVSGLDPELGKYSLFSQARARSTIFDKHALYPILRSAGLPIPPKKVKKDEKNSSPSLATAITTPGVGTFSSSSQSSVSSQTIAPPQSRQLSEMSTSSSSSAPTEGSTEGEAAKPPQL